MRRRFKILYVGDLREYGRCYQRFRVLRDLGHEVVGISIVPVDFKSGISPSPSVFQRLCNKLGYPLDRMGVNEKILHQLSAEPFDVLWIDKGLVIRPSTLRKVRKFYPHVKIVSYSEDDMFARHNQSVFYRKCLPLYDIVFTTKSYNCNPGELPSLGAKRVIFVDNAYDKHTHRPLEITEEERRMFGADVGFVGTFEEDRAEKMLYLAQNDVSVRVWGNGWGKWVNRHPNLKVENKPVYGDDYIKVLCSTRINLCFLRKMNRDLQTSRTMEIPACGAFMLAERTDEHRRLFEEDREAVYFSSKEELLEKVRYYLEHEEERLAIAKAGRERCLNSGYSFHERLSFMLKKVDELDRG